MGIFKRITGEEIKLIKLTKDDKEELEQTATIGLDMEVWQDREVYRERMQEGYKIRYMEHTADAQLVADNKQLKAEKDRIAKNVRYFVMSRYLVTTGDKYRLNHDDLNRMEEILQGRELRDDENPYK
jgi:hypothetical protein